VDVSRPVKFVWAQSSDLSFAGVFFAAVFGFALAGAFAFAFALAGAFAFAFAGAFFAVEFFDR